MCGTKKGGGDRSIELTLRYIPWEAGFHVSAHATGYCVHLYLHLDLLPVPVLAPTTVLVDISVQVLRRVYEARVRDACARVRVIVT